MPMDDDPFDLQRFVEAQNPVLGQVRAELAAGAKTSHWMWFMFPQHQALGRSAMARRYGIASAAEARAYWQHPLLGPRLKDCTALVLAVPLRSARLIFGTPDDLKLRSCLTLFNEVAPEEPVFRQALRHFFAGHADEATLALLKQEPPSTGSTTPG